MEIIAQYLQLPGRCIANSRITKAFFKRNFDLTLTERAMLDNPEIIKSINWLARINTQNANISLFNNSGTVVEEIQVITAEIGNADFSMAALKVAEFIQKHIPYHILLIIYHSESFFIHTCNKLINQNDSNKRVIEKRFFTQEIPFSGANDNQIAFLKSLTFAHLDKTNLKTFYDGYSERIINFQASGFTGVFEPRPQYRTRQDLLNMERLEALKKEVTDLQNKARKELQLKELLKLNTQLYTTRKEIERLIALIEHL